MAITGWTRLFLKGLGIGFSIAAPVGPIGVLCIRRSIADGPGIGFATGLGAAVADALYGCVAAFGLSAISGFLVKRKRWLSLLGGLFLCYLGLETLLSRLSVEAQAPVAGGALAAFATTVALTVTNPMTILSFVAVFAGFGVATTTDPRSALGLVLGVFLGSAAWWLLLSSGAGLLRTSITPVWMLSINRASGVVILAFGLRALTRMRRP